MLVQASFVVSSAANPPSRRGTETSNVSGSAKPVTASTQMYTMVQPDPETGEEPPTCWLHHQSDLMVSIYAALARLGVELDYFHLPPVDPTRPTPAVGSTTVATALVDRPEVRLVFEHMADPQFGALWAGWRGQPGANEPPTNNLLPPNRRFDLGDLGSSDDPEVEMKRRMVDDLRAALDGATLRPPAHHAMPDGIGGLGGANAFFDGIIDWVDGERTLEEVFEDIDSQWRAMGGLGEVTGF